jgi:hypothetical protein
MSINGIMNQAPSMYRQENKAEGRPTATADNNVSESDVIDLKAIKAVLYLGIKGDVYLPMEEGSSFNTFA